MSDEQAEIQKFVAATQLADIDAAIDAIFSHVDRLIKAGRLEALDEILHQLNPTKIPLDVAVAVLSICTCCKRELKWYGEVFYQLKQHLTDTIGTNKAERTLAGLEPFRGWAMTELIGANIINPTRATPGAANE